jgi:hypothetical protein
LPYRKAAELLEELLPASNARLSHTSVRRHTLNVGALLDQRVTDGLYQHYVIAGRVERDGQLGGHFAFRLEAFFREWWPKFRLTPPVELQCDV